MTTATEIDLTGMKCPMPIVHLNRAVRDAADGQALTVLADDPAFELDIAAWCRRTGHELSSFGSSDGKLQAVIRTRHD